MRLAWIERCFGHQACQLGISTRYFRVSRLLDQLALARADGSYPKLVQRLAKTWLLVLDDWGLASLSGQGRHDLLEVLDDRYARRGTILASQLPVKHWHDAVGDPTFGDAILDRLLNNAHRITIKGGSMRRLYDSRRPPPPPTTPDPSMSSTPSRSPLNPGRLDGFARNGWTTSPECARASGASHQRSGYRPIGPDTRRLGDASLPNIYQAVWENTHMGKATTEEKPREVLGIFYQQRDPFLYGCIAFVKYRPGGPPTKAYDQSAPFIIAQTLGPDDVIVHGSLDYLIRDIRRLVRSVDEQVAELDAALSGQATTQKHQGERGVLRQVPDDHQARRAYFEFTRRLAGTLILISTQARNLFQLLPRLDRKIGLFDNHGHRTGDIALTKLFTHFVHNQYLFLDGEHVSDLFPANPRRGAPISRTFMGYRFNWIEYIQSIKAAVEEVKLTDLTGLLRGRLKRLSLESPYSDIVFLVQNLDSFSRLFEAMPKSVKRYWPMLDPLLEEETKARLATLRRTGRIGKRAHLTVVYGAPNLRIHEELSERKFKVTVPCKWTIRNGKGRPVYRDERFRDLAVELDYETLLNRVDRVFGDDPLLDFRP